MQNWLLLLGGSRTLSAKVRRAGFFFPETDFSTAALLKAIPPFSPTENTLLCISSKSLTSFYAQWGSPKENTSTLLIGSSTGAQRGLWLIWHGVRRHLPPGERRILLLGQPAQLWAGQLLNQVQLTALTLPQLNMSLDKASTRIPSLLGQKMSEVSFPSPLWFEFGAWPGKGKHIIFTFSGHPEWKTVSLPWAVPTVACQQCCPGTILYTFWCGSSLHSLPNLFWIPLADFSLLIILRSLS